MKKLIVVFTCAASFAACRSSNGPGTGAPAVMPNSGNEYTYQVDAPQVQLQEYMTITNVSNNSFTAIRRSDTVNAFSTSDSERYALLASGDLWPIVSDCCCDSTPLPIASHRSFDPHYSGAAVPTKLNGFVNNSSSVLWHSQYEGQEMVFAAGRNFECSKVSKTVTVISISPFAGGGADTESVTHRYWYSPDIQFFVKDQERGKSGDSSNTYFTRTLVSCQLAK
ncbi:MAG TPA: hypothetical protein VFH95_11450 [Candidatus Kapabacteria bacterium]|nr:hypothetical protein [Candidatus Kapabacteria bacterium]